MDQKKGTNGHVERHSRKFEGRPLPFGAKIRYLPSAEKEVEKREKLESSLRDAIFIGYRMHTGGRWTGQYQLIDAEAFTEVAKTVADWLTSIPSARSTSLDLQRMTKKCSRHFLSQQGRFASD